MNTELKCPCCGLSLSPGTAVCPRCRLPGLDQIFLSKEEYQRWRREVLEPFKALYRPPFRLSGGDHHALILQGDKLYGLGSDRVGQLGGADLCVLSSPRLVARNVKTAAAGRSYSIYITTSGSVEVIGRKKYADIPLKFLNPSEVYAARDKNVFWIKDTEGKLFGFGDNSDSRIERRTETLVHQFSEKLYTYTGPGEFDISCGPRARYDPVSSIRQVIQNECKATSDYQKLTAKEPGSYYFDTDKRYLNLIRMGYAQGHDGTKLTCTVGTTAAPKLMRSNECIFTPTETSNFPDDLSNIYHNGCWESFRYENRVNLSVAEYLDSLGYLPNGTYKKILLLEVKSLFGLTVIVLDDANRLSAYVLDGDCQTCLGSVGGIHDAAFYWASILLLSMADHRLLKVTDIPAFLRSGGAEAFEELTLPEEA